MGGDGESGEAIPVKSKDGCVGGYPDLFDMSGNVWWTPRPRLARVPALMSTPKASARRRAASSPPPEPLAAAPRDKAARADEARPPPAASLDGQYRLEIPTAGFEGPLDLLLHLIQQHELDILDIPVSFVTEKFLAYILLMRSLSIDIASEYLVMAATLAHIKSKMLLPSVPAGQDDDGLPGEEDEDPRAELVLRLLEYQKYKAAAAELADRGTLGKDVFGRGVPEPVPQGPAPFAQPGVFSLLDAFEKLLKRTNVRLDHEVVFDRISITDRIVELTETLTHRRAMRFDEMLGKAGEGARPPTRFDVVITFLAILEMCRLRLIRVYQSDALAPIHVELSLSDRAVEAPPSPTPDPAPVAANGAPILIEEGEG
jgi:segregation and condensation protein A